MNFRVVQEYSAVVGDLSRYRENLEQQNFSAANKILEDLKKQDEFFRLKSDYAVFKNYREGDIRFLPTYKFDLGTDTYDTSKKQRTPSWCDRVLFQSKPPEAVTQQLYRSLGRVRISDHK